MYSERIIELIEELGHNDRTINRQIRADLLEIGESIVEPLIPKLKCDDISIVKDTLWVLGKIDDSRVIKPIIQLLGDDLKSVRNKAAKTLVNIGKEVLPAFLEQLSSKDVIRRRISLWYLPEFIDPTIEAYLIRSLDDEDALVRRNAVRAIGILNMSNHINYLIEALKDDNWEVRQWAAYSIGLVNKSKMAQNSLKDALNDDSVHVQYAAILACGDIGSKKFVKHLSSKINQNNLLLKAAAIKALGNIGSCKSIEPLISLYEKDDFYIRAEIILALGRIGGSKKVYSILKNAIGDDNLHKYALIALRLIGTIEANKILSLNTIKC